MRTLLLVIAKCPYLAISEGDRNWKLNGKGTVAAGGTACSRTWGNNVPVNGLDVVRFQAFYGIYIVIIELCNKLFCHLPSVVTGSVSLIYYLENFSPVLHYEP